jgi:NAD(P)H-dependent FMN reductase
MDASAMLNIPILLGSVRQDRLCLRVALFIQRALDARGHKTTLVDPLALQLPLLDRMYKEHPKGGAPETLERLASLYRAADGFMIVSGEYNNGIPPALKNLLDYFLEEYFFRPSAICCYSAGRYGGVRAAMQLRMVLSELGMPSIPSLLPIGGAAAVLDEEGGVKDEAALRGSGRFLDEFEWYARALAQARVGGTPY